MNADFVASCEGKIRFATYEMAKERANAVGSILSPYKCRHGNHYHKGKKGL